MEPRGRLALDAHGGGTPGRGGFARARWERRRRGLRRRRRWWWWWWWRWLPRRGCAPGCARRELRGSKRRERVEGRRDGPRERRCEERVDEAAAHRPLRGARGVVR